LRTVLLSWSFFQAEVIKLIGYDGREEWVHFDGLTTGSIIVRLIIDKLSAENGPRVIQGIENSINRGIGTFKVVSYQMSESYSDAANE
jgi:hypothetical protein